MTEDTTGTELTPEQTAAQEIEQKNHNQEQSFKRQLEKANAEIATLKESKSAAATVEAKASTEAPDLAGMIQQALDSRAETEETVAKAITEFPELKEYEAAIRESLAKPENKGADIEQVIGASIGIKNAMRIGANMNAERLQVAQESTSGGGDATIVIKTKEEIQNEKWMNSLSDSYKD